MQTKSGAICASPVVSESWLEQIAPPAIVGWSDVPCAGKATLVLYLFLVAVRARSLTRLHNGAADDEWPTLHAAGARREHPHSHAGSRGSTLWLVRLVFAFLPRSRLIHTSASRRLTAAGTTRSLGTICGTACCSWVCCGSTGRCGAAVPAGASRSATCLCF